MNRLMASLDTFDPLWGVIFNPPLGWILTTAVLLVALGSSCWLYGRDRRDLSRGKRLVSWVSRIGALAAMAWILAGPGEMTHTDTSPAAVPVKILVDTSASMSQRDVWDKTPTADDTSNDNLFTQPDGNTDGWTTRWSALQRSWLSTDFLDRVSEIATDLRVYRFDQELQPVHPANLQGLDPDGRQTDLYGAIQQAGSPFRGRGAGPDQQPLGVMVVLSDGHDTQRAIDPSAMEAVRRSGWRVMTVPVGAARSVPDIALSAWTQADRLLDGQSTWIDADITQTGLDDRAVRVDLLLEDKLIESQSVSFDAQPSVRLRFRVQPRSRPGESVTIHGYRLVAQLTDPDSRASTEPMDRHRHRDDEPFKDNNSRWVFVEVSNDRIKVALFEGQPYWDSRFLARTLGDDPQVDLTAVFSLGPDRAIATVTSSGHKVDDPRLNLAMIDSSWLNGFDVIVLGRHTQRFFPGHRAGLLADFVTQRGGALILSRGPAFDITTQSGQEANKLTESLLPVRWGQSVVRGLRLELTESGRSHPLVSRTRFTDDTVLTELPDMLAATQIEGDKAASVVLLRQTPYATSTPMAAVAHMNVGKGKVLAVLGEGLWRWAFLPSGRREYDTVFQTFWAGAIRWLVGRGEFLPGQSVSMNLSRLAVEPDEPLVISIGTRYLEPGDNNPVLTVTTPRGQSRSVSLDRVTEQSSRYTATIRPTSPGVYQLDLDVDHSDGPDSSTNSGNSQISGPKISRRFAVYDRSIEKLDPSARPDVLGNISKATGGRCWRLGERRQLLDYLRSLQQSQQIDSRFEYRINRPLAIGLIFGLFGLDWFIRRRTGLM